MDPVSEQELPERHMPGNAGLGPSPESLRAIPAAVGPDIFLWFPFAKTFQGHYICSQNWNLGLLSHLVLNVDVPKAPKGLVRKVFMRPRGGTHRGLESTARSGSSTTLPPSSLN